MKTRAYNQSISLLAHRDRTIYEMYTYLSEKGYPEVIVEDVINQLIDLGYLNDMRYIENYCYGNIKGKRYGIRRVKQNLKSKGIKEILLDKIPDFFSTQDQIECCDVLFKKKMNTYRGYSNMQKRHKISEFLMRKGYEYDMIRNVMSSYNFCDSVNELNDDSDEQYAELLRLYKKYRKIQENNGYVGKERDFRIRRYLYSKGFSGDMISELIKGEDHL